jgi:hypothetical protein
MSPWYLDMDQPLDTHMHSKPNDFSSISQDLGVRKSGDEILQQLTSAHDD